MPCTAPIITLLEPFQCLFTAPTWKKALALLRGTLLARGRRTVTRALWSTGHQQDPHFRHYHAPEPLKRSNIHLSAPFALSWRMRWVLYCI
jgi:hypothetical protein